MTKKEELVKERVDKILKHSNVSNKQIEDIYEIYNTREVQTYLEWKSTWRMSLKEWYNSLNDETKFLVKNLIALFNFQPEVKTIRRNKIKMEEIKTEVEVQPIEPEVKKEKRIYNKKQDKSVYIPIAQEIDKLRSEGVTFNKIRIMLREKYPNFKAETLILKYYDWKKNQNKQGE